MNYETDLSFFERLMNRWNLPFSIIKTDSDILRAADMGLRSAFGLNRNDISNWSGRLGSSLNDRIIYYITDEFFCRYALLVLPDYSPRSVLAIGPFVTEAIDADWIQKHFIEQNNLDSGWLTVLDNYFRQVSFLENENLLVLALNTLGEQIWGEQQFTTESIVRGISETLTPLSDSVNLTPSDNIVSKIRLIEKRYEIENELISAVTQGSVQKAQLLLFQFPPSTIEQRTEPLRNLKNYTIILNTVLRKSAEFGKAHPLYIDRVSSEFARQIETITDLSFFPQLWQEMIRRYCLLVKKHTMKEYSHLIQQVITRIDFDLSADLTLKAMAHSFNVNPCYLSTLFKRETGCTLTDYVNQKRMEHASYLLSNTRMSVSEIAKNCGIQDDNYFTKVFKRYAQITPTQFRQERINLAKNVD